MEAREGVIICRLDLAIRLQDTTTGLEVSERNTRFILGDEEVRPISRGFGNYILINHGRENCLMQVLVYGFEPYSAYIDYEDLDERLPAVDVFLIPSEKDDTRRDFISLSGKLKGISSLECIHPNRPFSSIREFDKKKKIMTIYAPNRRMNMVHTYYGLLGVGTGTYECIEITEQIDNQKVVLKEPLQQEFSVNAPICRRLFGKVDDEGNYLLRIRNDGKNLKYLVRYVVGEDVRYKSVDFHNLEGVTLD
jgi:hypothetical protein